MARQTPQPTSRLHRMLPYILLVAGVVGTICAFIITNEKFNLLENPHYIPTCNLNPIISCGSVMASKQAQAFGFPNPLIGLIAFGALSAIGTALLAGAQFKRWYWRGVLLGSVFGVAFVHWLFFQSVYRIHALCPYCMVVWVVTITTFWYVLLYNFEQRFVVLPSRYGAATGTWLRRHHLDILIVWFLVIAFFIFKHFWYFFGKNL